MNREALTKTTRDTSSNTPVSYEAAVGMKDKFTDGAALIATGAPTPSTPAAVYTGTLPQVAQNSIGMELYLNAASGKSVQAKFTPVADSNKLAGNIKEYRLVVERADGAAIADGAETQVVKTIPCLLYTSRCV